MQGDDPARSVAALRFGLRVGLAGLALAGLTTCEWITVCNTGQVGFTLPTPDDSLAFLAFLCIEGGTDGGPSFEMVAQGGDGPRFQAEFFDPRRPDEARRGLFDSTSSEHCDEGVRVEIYRDDQMLASASGSIGISLSMSKPDVCTIELRPVEAAR